MPSFKSFVVDALIAMAAVAAVGAAVVAGIEFWIYCTYVKRNRDR